MCHWRKLYCKAAAQWTRKVPVPPTVSSGWSPQLWRHFCPSLWLPRCWGDDWPFNHVSDAIFTDSLPLQDNSQGHDHKKALGKRLSFLQFRLIMLETTKITVWIRTLWLVLSNKHCATVLSFRTCDAASTALDVSPRWCYMGQHSINKKWLSAPLNIFVNHPTALWHVDQLKYSFPFLLCCFNGDSLFPQVKETTLH